MLFSASVSAKDSVNGARKTALQNHCNSFPAKPAKGNVLSFRLLFHIFPRALSAEKMLSELQSGNRIEMYMSGPQKKPSPLRATACIVNLFRYLFCSGGQMALYRADLLFMTPSFPSRKKGNGYGSGTGIGSYGRTDIGCLKLILVACIEMRGILHIFFKKTVIKAGKGQAYGT